MAAALALVATSISVLAETRETSSGQVSVTQVVGGLDTPWAIDFLPDGAPLITERDGRLLLIEDGAARTVSGTPRVRTGGQGGLLDVAVARNFAQTGEIFLTYSEPREGGAGTALAVAQLDRDTAALRDLVVIFRQVDPSDAGRHFGSRVAETDDGTLFVTVGDRADRNRAQERSSHKGKVLRIQRDGAVPGDNPFQGVSGAMPEIWSLGHRNPQGIALDAAGAVWTVEHGPRGGDEVNRPVAGRNYGWPVTSFGREYSGGQVGVGSSAPGMEQPLHVWDPSIAPSSLMIYSGRLWPEWRGHLFVGSLTFDMIERLAPSGDGVAARERLFEGDYPRIRDLAEAPDGSIWFLSDGDGAAYRIAPEGGG